MKNRNKAGRRFDRADDARRVRDAMERVRLQIIKVEQRITALVELSRAKAGNDLLLRRGTLASTSTRR